MLLLLLLWGRWQWKTPLDLPSINLKKTCLIPVCCASGLLCLSLRETLYPQRDSFLLWENTLGLICPVPRAQNMSAVGQLERGDWIIRPGVATQVSATLTVESTLARTLQDVPSDWNITDMHRFTVRGVSAAGEAGGGGVAAGGEERLTKQQNQ